MKRTNPRRIGLALVLLGLAGAAGYARLFGTFVWWDDEGYVMLTLRQFLDGAPLYDRVYSQYGPAYYLVHGALHAVTGLPVTHEITRWKTLIEWLAVASGSGLLVGRITGSWGWGAVASVLVFLHLDRLALEPGHPQGLVALLTVCVLLLGLESESEGGASRGSLGGKRSFGAGLLIGLAAAVKPNVGLLLLLVWWAAGSVRTPGPAGFVRTPGPGRSARALEPAGSARARRAAAGLWIVLLLGVPVAVALRQPLTPDRLALPGTVLAGLLALGVAGHAEGGPSRRRWPGPFAAGAGLALGGAVLGALATGSSPRGLVDGLLRQPAALDRAVYRPAALLPLAFPVAFLGVAAAAMAARGRRGAVVLGRWLLAALAVGVLAAYAWPTVESFADAIRDRGYPAVIVSLASILAWVIWFPPVGSREGAKLAGEPGDGGPEGGGFDRGRVLLALAAVSLPLMAYPVPGSQMALGSFPLLLVAVVATADLARQRPGRETGPGAGPSGSEGSAVAAALRRRRFGGAVTWMLVLAAGSLAVRAGHELRRLGSLEPLGLAGAAGVRLPPRVAAEYRWVVATLRARCETFVFGNHNRDSFYLWTGLAPPTAWNPPGWKVLLDERRQQEVAAALRTRSKACVVWGPGPTLGEGRSGPLAEEIERRFAPALERGRFEIWLPRPRSAPPPQEPDTETAGQAHEEPDHAPLGAASGALDPDVVVAGAGRVPRSRRIF